MSRRLLAGIETEQNRLQVIIFVKGAADDAIWSNIVKQSRQVINHRVIWLRMSSMNLSFRLYSCDTNAPSFRSFLQVFPLKQTGAFVHELVIQGLRGVIVDEFKRLTRFQVIKAVKDHWVTITGLNIANINLEHEISPGT
jgi:hypothetical protein